MYVRISLCCYASLYNKYRYYALVCLLSSALVYNGASREPHIWCPGDVNGDRWRGNGEGSEGSEKVREGRTEQG